MAERSGKVGAFYATSGTGHLTSQESGTLTANAMWLAHKNVVVSNVYKHRTSTASEYSRWTCTPRGYLTIPDAGATSSAVAVTYRWWAEEGESKADSGSIKQYGGFFDWSIDFTGDALDVTDFEDAGHRNYIGCQDGWTGAATRHWVDSGLLNLRGTKIILKFYVDDDDTDKGTDSSSDTGKRYEGYGIITGINLSTAVDAIVDEALTFQGVGELSYET